MRQQASRQVLRQELIEALAFPGCFLCDMRQRKSQRYVETLLDTAVVDVAQRDHWREVKGFCRWHAHLALSIPQSPSSLAILYEDLLRHEIARVTPLLAQNSQSGWWRLGRQFKQHVQSWLQHWQQPRRCPVCDLWAEQERLYLTILLEEWDVVSLQEAFVGSAGLCLPHVACLINESPSHANLPQVLAAQQACMQELHADLQEFIRKQDYRFAQEPFGREANAWQRVVAWMVGTMRPASTPPPRS